MIRNTMIATMSGMMILVACGEKPSDQRASANPKGKLNWTAYGEAFKVNRKSTLSMDELGKKMASDAVLRVHFMQKLSRQAPKWDVG